MPDLSKKQASLLAILFFFLTIVLSLLFPHHIILLSGLQIVVFLSVFVKGKRSSLFAGILSAVLVLLHAFLNRWSANTVHNWISYAFVLLFILFTVLIVFYIKRLFARMEQDKTHERSLFENATEGFVVTSSQGDIVLVNPSACRMFGYEEEELV